MVQTNIRDAKARLSAYVGMVEQGEEVVILRRGKPVAILKPVEEAAELTSMKEFRKTIKVKGTPASETLIKMRTESRD
jgi:prevent-host-death family protein